jgi:hypothetical protein
LSKNPGPGAGQKTDLWIKKTPFSAGKYFTFSLKSPILCLNKEESRDHLKASRHSLENTGNRVS